MHCIVIIGLALKSTFHKFNNSGHKINRSLQGKSRGTKLNNTVFFFNNLIGKSKGTKLNSTLFKKKKQFVAV